MDTMPTIFDRIVLWDSVYVIFGCEEGQRGYPETHVGQGDEQNVTELVVAD